MRDTCARLIAAFREPDGCEFISEFAVPFPTFVFLDLMAMPRERASDFLAWEDALMRAADPTDRVRAAQAIYEYLKGHKSRHRRRLTMTSSGRSSPAISKAARSIISK